MRGIPPFSDTRLRAYCIYCTNKPGTRDHVPPSIFLDRPYPDHLPIVPSCRECNEAASLDEEYLACLLEVLVCGTAVPEDLERTKVASALRHSSGLRNRLKEALKPESGCSLLFHESNRVHRVLEKTARGLWSYETSETTAHLQADVRVSLANATIEAELAAFYTLDVPEILPEVGSRMTMRLVSQAQLRNDWVNLQQGRFAYAVEVLGDAGRVKLVLRDYLLAEVTLRLDW